MSAPRYRPPRGGAALAVLAALAAPGCAKQGAAPETGAAVPAAAPAQAAPNATAAPPPRARVANTGAASNAAVPAQTTAPSTAAAPAAVLGEAPAAPTLTEEQMQRRSPSAALVETFNAACADPREGAVARAAKRLGFAPATPEALREAPGGAIAAMPGGAAAWSGPEEIAGAVLVWDPSASTCELRAAGVNLLLVESAFSRLPKALEEEGASVMRLEAPTAQAGGTRTRQVLLVQPGLFNRPERARVLRFGHRLGASPSGAATEAESATVVLSARSVSAPR